MCTQSFEQIYHILTHRHQDFAYASQQWWQPKQKSLGIKDVLYFESYPSCIAAWRIFIVLWYIQKILMSVC